MRHALIAVLSSLVLFASLPSHARDGIYPLEGVDPSLPDAELRFLDPVVGDARFVGIGESVHGSDGMIKIQHRLIKYLVLHHGFRTLMWENPVIRSIGLTEWVEKCPNEPPPINLLYDPVKAQLEIFEWI